MIELQNKINKAKEEYKNLIHQARTTKSWIKYLNIILTPDQLIAAIDNADELFINLPAYKCEVIKPVDAMNYCRKVMNGDFMQNLLDLAYQAKRDNKHIKMIDDDQLYSPDFFKERVINGNIMMPVECFTIVDTNTREIGE